MLRVNLVGAVNVAHAFAPAMAEARRGTVLFLSSVAGQIGSQTDPPYSAAKAGLINFAQCAAKDLAPFGVRVNTLCPGMVQTPLNRSVWQAWADRQPAGRRGSPTRSGQRRRFARLVPLEPLADARGRRRDGGLPGVAAGREHHRPDVNVDGGFVMR